MTKQTDTPRADSILSGMREADTHTAAENIAASGLRDFERDRATLRAALVRYKAAVDGASFADEEMTPEFNREYMEASAQAAAALAKVAP